MDWRPKRCTYRTWYVTLDTNPHLGQLPRINHEVDLRHPKPNWNKTPGYTEAETSSFARILNTSAAEPDENKFVDAWRNLHPDKRHFSYFSYRFNCRAKGVGWRIDHCEYLGPCSIMVPDLIVSVVVLSERLFGRVKMCEIRDEIYGASDHCPVTLEIEGEP